MSRYLSWTWYVQVVGRRYAIRLTASNITQNEDQQPWKPFPRDALGPNFAPMAGLTMTTFRAQCRLCECCPTQRRSPDSSRPCRSFHYQ